MSKNFRSGTYQPARVNPPGEHPAYSNWATGVAALIVANVSGMTIEDYVQQNILDVLGMTHTTMEQPLPPGWEADLVKAYQYESGRYVEKNFENVIWPAAGAVSTTVSDMTRFARALLNDGAWEGGRILRAETLQQMLDEGFTLDERIRGMELGFLKRREGLDIFGHEGHTTIFRSHFGMSKEEDLMLFFSFNGGGGVALVEEALLKSFYDEFFPRNVPVIAPPADFAERAGRYAGTYKPWRSSFTKWEAVLFRLLGGTKVAPQPDGTLLIGKDRYVEVDENLFRQVDDYGRVAFQEDEQGRINGHIVDGKGHEQFYKAPFYETMDFTKWLIGLSLLVFVGVFLRLGYQWPRIKALQGMERNAFWASIGVAGFNLMFFMFLWHTVRIDVLSLAYAIPTSFKISLVFPPLAAGAAKLH
jgi:hypothetical protein